MTHCQSPDTQMTKECYLGRMGNIFILPLIISLQGGWVLGMLCSAMNVYLYTYIVYVCIFA